MRHSVRILAVVMSLLLTQRLVAQTHPDTGPSTRSSEKYLRVVVDPAASRLETGVVTFTNADGVKVDLIAAVHIGEKSYYQGLNKSFAQYDTVLYEMVKPKEAGAPQPGDGANSMIGQMQHTMKDLLALEFQLDEIDYKQANFVHADLDAETFARLQKERGETFPELMLKALQRALSNPQQAAPGKDAGQAFRELLQVLTRPDGERQIKLMLAQSMQDVEATAAGFAGPNGESVIVTERNKKVIEVLKQTLAGGKKNIGIFYGAAHMPDLEKRMAELGFTPTKSEYRLAWDLKIRPDQPSAVEKLMDKLMELGLQGIE
jgi:hypothetical protein